jgi:hypothetical protein
LNPTFKKKRESTFFLKIKSISKGYSAQVRDMVVGSNAISLKPADLDFMNALPAFKAHMQKQNDRILRM